MVDTRLSAAPKYVPEGYALAATKRDAEASGFATLSPQITYVYATNGSGKEAAGAIEVHHTVETGQELASAVGDARTVRIGAFDAVYQNAMNVAVGVDSAGKAIVEQDHGWHSITLTSTTGTYAVRGPSSVPYEDLARVINSVPL